MTQKPKKRMLKWLMWASSRIGPRGFRVSLARTATKEDFIEVQFSVSEIPSCYRRAKHGFPLPHPGAGRAREWRDCRVCHEQNAMTLPARAIKTTT